MDDPTDIRNQNGDVQAKRTIPEFTGGPLYGGNRHPRRTLLLWAELLIGRWYRCAQTRREGKTPDEVQLRRDDHALDALIEDARVARTEVSAGPWPSFLDVLVKLQREAKESREVAAWGGFLDWLGALDLSDPADLQHAAHAFDGYVLQVAGSASGDPGDPGDPDTWRSATPEPVVNLMLDLAAPVPGDRVYDPCFGYGGLLAEAVRRMRAVNGSAAAGPRVPLAAITGLEENPFTYPVGLCRVMLAGATCLRLANADALEKPVPDERDARFDCILADPPIEPVENDEGDFLKHIMGQLRPGGRAVVALPDRPLFHADSLSLRKALLSEYRVQAVVALPAGAFEPCTAIPMSVVMFSRDEPRDAVRFATVSPMAWEAASDDTMAISERISDRTVPTGYVSTGVESWSVPVRELALREYELIAKKSGNELLDAEMKRLHAADSSLERKRIEDVAEVFPGQSYDRDEDLGSSDFLKLLGAADVTDVRIRPPSYSIAHWVWDDSAEPFLRVGDLLVPMEDTIGSIGLVEDGSWDGVMAGETIALVRPHAGLIMPEFLAALLRSPAYWFWLSGHAAGSTIRKLPISVLRTLTIPVPSLYVQDAVIKALSGPRADALAVLHRLLAQTADHPVALWMESPLAARLVTLAARTERGGAGGDADGLRALSEIARSIPSVTDTEETEDDGRSYTAWLAIARKAAAALDDVVAIPPGAGRMAVLQIALARLHESLGMLSNAEGTTVERLRSVTESMVKMVEYEVDAMQLSGGLRVDAETAEVEAGGISEVRLRFTNGSVPLRDLRITARQPDGTVTTDVAAYLAESATHEMPVVVCARDSTESHRIDVAWQARRLDAAPIQGGEPVPVLVKASGQAVAAGDLGSNPYVVGNPIDRPDMFFGRGDIMDKIRRQLGGDHANVVLLEGNRRTGKTSILRQLGKAGALPGWIPVYCDFQALDSMATADVFKLLALRIGCALSDAGIETWVPDLERSDSGKPFQLAFGSALRRAFADGRPFETLEVYLEAAIRAANPRRVLLMIDEFDKLQEGIDSGHTGPQVPENLRHLLQHQPGLGAIITGSRRLKRLREEYWSALFGLGYRIPVSELPKDHARRLVTKPVDGRLRYLPQARDRLVDLCAGHPFLIQSLCSRVFDQAADGGERTITPDLLDRAVIEMVRDNEHLRTLWDYAGTERRRLILALCHSLEDRSDAVTIRFLLRTLAEHGVRARDQDMADDIAELEELEFIHFDKSYRGGTYRLSVPLMARWMVEMNVDFEELVVRAKREAEQQ